MRKIRLGIDIKMQWSITTNGAATPLEGRELSAELSDPYGVKKVLPFTSEGNVATLNFPGVEQKRLGKYSLTMWENKGKEGQNAVDMVGAFELVRTTEETGGADESNLETVTVDLGTSNIVAGIPGKDGVTPLLKIEEDKWWVSYDKGLTWSILGPAVDEHTRYIVDNLLKNEEGRIAAEKSRAAAELERAAAEMQREKNATAAIDAAVSAAADANAATGKANAATETANSAATKAEKAAAEADNAARPGPLLQEIRDADSVIIVSAGKHYTCTAEQLRSYVNYGIEVEFLN